MQGSPSLHHIQHGTERRREVGPPKLGLKLKTKNFSVSRVPPHVINLKLTCVDNFMVMQLGPSRAMAAFDSDKLRPLQLGPGYPIIGRTGSEFNCRATSTKGVIAFHFTDRYLENTLLPDGDFRHFESHPSQPRFDHHLLQLFHLTEQALLKASPDTLYIESLLAAGIVRAFSNTRNHRQAANKKVPTHQLKRAEEYLRAMYTHKLSLHDIAQVAGLSPYHFARSFKAFFGSTPSQYLQRLRLERCIELLEDRDRSIEEIAEEMGFSSPSNFGAFFKQHTGFPPGAYRRFLDRNR